MIKFNVPAMNVRRILCVGVVAVIMTVSSACSTGRNADINDSYTYDQQLKSALSNTGSVTVYSFDSGSVGAPMPDAKWYKDFLTYFGDTYNGSVMTVAVEWQDWEKQFISDFSAGIAPDLIYLYEKNFLPFVNRSAVMSSSDLKSRGVVGLDHPQLAKSKNLINQVFEHNSECYSFACALAEADMIFVNEDLFELYGVKSPSEYYIEGLWTQKTFELCSRQIARDLNGDSINDIYGFYGWDPSSFVAAAGGELISVEPDGSLKLCLGDSQTVTGLTNFRQIYAEQKSGTFVSSWSTGNTAMISWLPSNEYARLKSGMLDFEWSVVPFPLDDNNKSGVRPGKCYGWAVTSSSSNPQGGINYVIAYNTYSLTHPDRTAPDYISLFGPSRWQMFVDCTDNIQIPVHSGVGELDKLQWQLWEALAQGSMQVNEVIDRYRPLFKEQIEAQKQK